MSTYKNISIAFTGHRPSKLGGYNESSKLIKNIKKELKYTINNAIKDGYVRFISGMAMGIDTWAAEIVLELKEEYPDIKLICAVPFKGQETKWYEETKRRYWNIIEQADEMHVISEGKYSPAKMQIRNEWMVDNSAALIAVWDGTSGGTGNCVRYARYANKVNSRILTINPDEFS